MKKFNRIVLAGGNGYLGKVLTAHFKHLSKEVVVLGRKPKPATENISYKQWDCQTEGDWTQLLVDADLLVNLCGKNVNCRYTRKNREEIIQSRVGPTTLLGDVISKMKHPPKLWINITSATIYRHAEDRPQDEASGEIGYGFSIDVCRQWEAHLFQSATPGTRKIALRMGIVLGRSDGAFPRLLNLVKAGLGGKQGDGEQYVSWIHEQDVAKTIEWLADHPGLEGIINCSSPAPVKNAIMMRHLRNAWGVSSGLPSPTWLLEIGAVLIGTETELILKSRWVVPTRLLDSGYKFMFPSIDHAFKDLLSIKL